MALVLLLVLAVCALLWKFFDTERYIDCCAMLWLV